MTFWESFSTEAPLTMHYFPFPIKAGTPGAESGKAEFWTSAPLLSRVIFAVHSLNSVGIHMGINLGRHHIGMPQQLLHDPQIRPA